MMMISHGRSAAIAMLRALQEFDGIHRDAMGNVTACNMTDEQIAERDRPVSRQVRRQMERDARKGRKT